MDKRFSRWITVTRPWSFPASLMPAIVAFGYAYFLANSSLGMEVNWSYGVIALLGAVLFQAGGNLVSDYFDYIYHVDREEMYGTNRHIVDRVLMPKQVIIYGLILVLLGSGIGVFLVGKTGMPLLVIGAAGFFFSIFYYRFKYQALGDLVIFVVYGLLISLGTLYVLSGEINYEILAVTTPIGLLITAILHANNTRDMLQDAVAQISTPAMVIGLSASRVYYASMLVLSYVGTILLIVADLLPIASVLTLLSIPLAIRNVREMNSAQMDSLELIQALDGKTAQLVMLYGVLLVVSLFL